MCQKHYAYHWRRGDLQSLAGYGRVGCRVEGCTRPHTSKGYCNAHYKRVLAHGDPQAEWAIKKGWRPWSINARAIGATTVDPNGYVRVFLPDHAKAQKRGWIFQHRLVMADVIGRDLFDDELVHHKNGDRQDNRPENLELCVKRQPPGQRAVDALQWAREIVARYDGQLFM